MPSGTQDSPGAPCRVHIDAGMDIARKLKRSAVRIAVRAVPERRGVRRNFTSRHSHARHAPGHRGVGGSDSGTYCAAARDTAVVLDCHSARQYAAERGRGGEGATVARLVTNVARRSAAGLVAPLTGEASCRPSPRSRKFPPAAAFRGTSRTAPAAPRPGGEWSS